MEYAILLEIIGVIGASIAIYLIKVSADHGREIAVLKRTQNLKLEALAALSSKVDNLRLEIKEDIKCVYEKLDTFKTPEGQS